MNTEIEKMKIRVMERMVVAAFAFAESSPFPNRETAADDVYSRGANS